MKKHLKKIPLLLLALLHASFLLAIALEQTGFAPMLGFTVAIALLVIIAYSKVPMQDSKHLKEDFAAVLFVMLGAAITYLLHVHASLGSVIAAASLGTAASFVPTVFRQNKLAAEVPAASYCGAFVGMSSPNVAGSLLFILMASLIAGVLLVFSKNIFQGYGGKLGTIAFGGVALTYLLVFAFLS